MEVLTHALFFTILYMVLEHTDVKTMDKEFIRNAYSFHNQTFIKANNSTYQHGNLANTTQAYHGDRQRLPELICKYQKHFPTTDIPVLTLFTTMMNKESKVLINSITIRNWAQFVPIVKPVLFLASKELDSALAHDAKSHGWDVMIINKTNIYGTPVFKDMFIRVRKHYRSVFHGYSNGDILYDGVLMKTLLAISKVLPKLKSTMVVGNRKNLNMTKYLHYKYGLENIPVNTSIDQVLRDHDANHTQNPLWCFKEVEHVGRFKTIRFMAYAIDYFFLSNHSFPWNKIKDVVIGRPAYDNYFLIFAKDHETRTIDASKTINAVHQTGEDGNLAGAKGKIDTRYNRHLIGHVNYGRGATYLNRIYTYLNAGAVIVAKRLYKDRKVYDTKDPITK